MNPTALITGGSRGIGFAISLKLCENGYDVAINGVRPESSVTEAMEELRSAGTQVIYCQGDIGSEEDRGRIVSKLKTEYGRLNLLVNNAGVAPKERLDPLKASRESFDRLMRINLKGPYFLTQALAGWMVEQKQQQDSFEATIINIGSISATVVSFNRGDYCISKAGLAMHSKVWAVRLAEYGIPVYEVRPGVIKTDMTSAVTDKYDKLIGEGLTVQPRWGYPEDVARAALSLARGDFPYSTGEVIMVDGGLTIPRL
jgi:3-oxoacyl-[acyl-carrier protein] reductase